MKSVKILIINLSAFILLCIISSCKDKPDPNYESFLIKVDSLQMPDNIAVNEPSMSFE